MCNSTQHTFDFSNVNANMLLENMWQDKHVDWCCCVCLCQFPSTDTLSRCKSCLAVKAKRDTSQSLQQQHSLLQATKDLAHVGDGLDQPCLAASLPRANAVLCGSAHKTECQLECQLACLAFDSTCLQQFRHVLNQFLCSSNVCTFFTILCTYNLILGNALSVNACRTHCVHNAMC